MDPRLPEPHLRDEFRRELRARLMQEAVTALGPGRRGTAWAFLRPAMGVGVAGVILVAGAGTAAAGSVPGDTAFPLKKTIENIHVTLTFDDVQRVELLSEIADRRLAELQTVVDRADESKAPTASEEFTAAVVKFRAAVDAIQRAAPADKSEKVQDLVDAAREKHEAVLDAVQQKLDNEDARDAIERAKDEENKDTHSDRDQKDRDPQKTARPTRTPTPARTSHAAETPRATNSPRSTERPAPRINTSPVPRFTPQPEQRDSD